MKKIAELISSAGGPIIDKESLIEALQAKRLAEAALESPLMKMNNVMVAPHNLNFSPAAWKRGLLESISSLLDGRGISANDILDLLHKCAIIGTCTTKRSND